MTWILTFVGFALLVILHELGHFTAAKLVGMRVERFSLFFPPLLARVRRGETEYAIGSIPLGGYVKITGMNPAERSRRRSPTAPTSASPCEAGRRPAAVREHHDRVRAAGAYWPTAPGAARDRPVSRLARRHGAQARRRWSLSTASPRGDNLAVSSPIAMIPPTRERRWRDRPPRRSAEDRHGHDVLRRRQKRRFGFTFLGARCPPGRSAPRS
jgi:hypothetical protein